MTGAGAQTALDEVGITVNKNTIPFETQSPVVTSGIRIGTPAVTSRGMKEPEMRLIGAAISRILYNIGDESEKPGSNGLFANSVRLFRSTPNSRGRKS